MGIQEFLTRNSTLDPKLVEIFSNKARKLKKRKFSESDVGTKVSKKEECLNPEEDTPEVKSYPPREIQREKRKEFKEKTKNTIFVGNLPISVTEKKSIKLLKKTFSQYGQIESIRFRSLPVQLGLKRKVSFIKKIFNKKGDTLNSYIVFSDPSSAKKALEQNGKLLFDRHIRVDSAEPEKNTRRTVFVGNLPFSITEEELIAQFSSCGEISYVRVVRDKKLNVGRGVGYVCFVERSSAILATKLNGKEIQGRKIRVKRCKKLTTHAKLMHTKKVLEGTRSKPGESIFKPRKSNPGKFNPGKSNPGKSTFKNKTSSKKRKLSKKQD